MKKKRFKINDDTMTTIVVSSLVFCAVIVIVSMVLMCFGVDTSPIVDSTLRLFGFELGACGALKVYDKFSEKEEKKAERRRLRREEILKNDDVVG